MKLNGRSDLKGGGVRVFKFQISAEYLCARIAVENCTRVYLIDKAFAYLESEGEHGHHTGYDDGQRASESLKKDMSSFYALHTLNQYHRIGTTFDYKIT